MPQLKQFKSYIPKLIKDELDKLIYPRKDNLYVVIDLIYRKQIYYKSDLQKRYGFTEIALSQFKELLPSNDNLNEDLQFLIDNHLIIRNEFYIISIRPKSYKIPSEYMSELVGVKIQNKNINKRILKQIQKRKKAKVKNLEFAKTKYFKTFKIDIEGATSAILNKTIHEIEALAVKRNLKLSRKEILDIIECKNDNKLTRFKLVIADKGTELNNILHCYITFSIRVNAINDGFLFFKRNSTNGRLDTNLTSLPSFLRPYIHCDEKLMNLDIKNSQPYFLYTMVKNRDEINVIELNRYKNLVVSGEFYDFLMEEYKKYTGHYRTRKQMKLLVYKIFYSKNASFLSQKNFFSSLFPTIMQFINTCNSEKSNELANQLTSIESYSVLDIIMPNLEKLDIIPFTIHDSFVCKESEVKIIEQTITDTMIELYGVAPNLHCDYIVEEEIEEEDNEDDDSDWIGNLGQTDEEYINGIAA